MTKVIIMSMQSQHGANILNRDKMLELRKNIPKDFVGWVYIYITKAKPYLFRLMTGKIREWFTKIPFGWVVNRKSNFNGKVVARFWFDEYEKINLEFITNSSIVYEYRSEKLSSYDLITKTCLQEHEIVDYLKAESGYVWHIKQLEIFDKPMQLSDFYKYTKETITQNETNLSYKYNMYRELSKAPQSWQYVWLREEL